MQFGYVDQGLSETADLQKQFNINTYAPTMLVFKENIDKPADIIQVHHILFLFTVNDALKIIAFVFHEMSPVFGVVMFVLCRLKE